MMRVGYLGPAGTHTEEALLASAPGGVERVPLPSIRDVVLAVQQGTVERAVVPIENSLEGSVNATLDVLATEALQVTIVGEVVHAIGHCLIAREELALSEVRHVASHPQAIAQCARFLREELPHAEMVAAASTADAVRLLSERSEPGWAALGNRLAAALYGARVLREDVQDEERNHTRFVWLAPVGAEPAADGRRWKTSVVFWGGGDATPGWLVRCLSELSERGVNMTRIESRPRRMGLGHYMFFVDVDGRDTVPPVSEALAALARHCEGIRTLGSYPAAEPRPDERRLAPGDRPRVG